MSQRSSRDRTAAVVRPLAPYEPAPSQPEPSEPPGSRPHSGQLALPLRPVARRQQDVAFELGACHHPPGDAELAQLVTALVEVTAGARSPDSLRDRLSEPLRQRLRGDPRPWLGRYFLVTRVHRGYQGDHILHVNATVHERARRVAFATSSCLSPLGWGGWQVIDFSLLGPALRRRTPHAA